MSDIRQYFCVIKNSDNENNKNSENENNDIIHVFTDGSSINNGSKTKIHYGGIGIYIDNTNEQISETLSGKLLSQPF